MAEEMISDFLCDASETLRESLHYPTTPTYPSHLYARCGWTVEILSRMREVTTRLHDATERAPALWETLGSDDDTPSSDHVNAACAELLQAAAQIDGASRHANMAWSALSHLKLRS